ncbi:hypothetical protein LTR37_019209 [Vermiconidia calcicola]|uniref:Uncharacterized protein n=1 Tax=Vermiconidia calcicola TaxID=1690605 RepID=A0ACC3MF33_9PEZI|nr:hypothetical protein LTR37_019209 [Vermiconidia calcicola]
MSAPRLGLRFGQAFRQNFQNQMRFAQRRYQSTATTADAAGQSAFGRFFNSPIGPKTVHFWAPIMKVPYPPAAPPRPIPTVSLQWGLVLAGASDFARPASSLSLTQNAALMCTGAIWTRWCFIIKPQNLFLASVNFLLFCVGATQVTRVMRYQSELKGQTLGENMAEKAQEGKAKVGELVEDPGKIKEVVGGK